MKRFSLAFLLGVSITALATLVYWAMEALLMNQTTYNRGLIEGAVLAQIMTGGSTLAIYILKRLIAKGRV